MIFTSGATEERCQGTNRVAARYHDLATGLMKHTWIAILYAFGCLIGVYILGITANASIIFLAVQIPTVGITTAVLRDNKRLRWRVPLVWTITAMFVWGYSQSSPTATSQGSSNEVAACSLFALIGLWFVRGVNGSINEFKNNRQSPLAVSIGNTLSAWGATLQVAFLSLILIKAALIPFLKSTIVGVPLMTLLAAITLTSPVSWFPLGLLLIGLTLFAAVRFKDDPYLPKGYADVLPLKLPPLINELFSALRLPTWLCTVIFGFVAHFVQQVWVSFRVFVERWMGRMLLITVSLILPTIIIMAAHLSMIVAAEEIAVYLSGKQAGMGRHLFVFLSVHLEILVGMCLYVLSTVALALEITPTPLDRIPRLIKTFVISDGLPGANAVGRSFSLYGILFLVVPIAATLPGSPPMGIFSVSYAATVIATLVFFIVTTWKHRQS